MRKAQKQQIEETIRQMEEAHDELKMYIEKRIIVQAKELLADCQNAAVAIGTLIENTEGEGHPAVMVLEEYCEQVYQIHEYLSSDCNVNTNKIYKSLRQKLIKASNSIRNDIKIRTEAVFLPYKASMWDSLESVWKAADADPDCDAYVIPIPYFDKNPDGSFREMHYEGGQYPNYVPTTRYDAFDFGKHMPDVIYIHNAYDDWNLVTSVHPDFYSKNLKKYTDKLVYIPYFVLSEIDSDNEQAAEGMKHFCFMPGIINADKVIVQSENMKKIYVREYLKAAKKYGLTGKHLDKTYLEKKFLGTGSPKFEKVLNTKKEDLEIPAEWLKVIEKPDGSWKKIIFYNNSIGALLQHSEKMLRKMESVFEIFKENKDEVALLWRPHPLIQATIESMRPQLWFAYDKIVTKYREEGWAIYDDSSDIDRAIALSDAYYGDGSSVVQMYQQIGKPIMIQNVDELVENVSENYFVTRWLKDGEYVYFVPFFVSFGLNVFIKYNLQNSKIEWILPIEKESGQQDGLYADVLKYKNKVVLVPLHAKNFAIIDLEIQKIEYIPIPVQDVKVDYGFFSKGIIYKNELIAVGYLYPRIVRINLDDYKIRIVNGWHKDLHNILSYESCIVGDSIYGLVNSANILLKYDFSKDETVLYQLENKGKSAYYCICYDGQDFWVTGNGIHFLKWNEKKHDSYEILLTEDTGDIPEGTMYRYSTSLNGKQYFFPTNKEAPVVVVDLRDNMKSDLIWENELDKKGFRVNSCYKYKDDCYLFNYQEKKTYKISDDSHFEIFNRWQKDPKWKGKLFCNFHDVYIKEGGLSLIEFITMSKK
jgi:hypothetical protein